MLLLQLITKLSQPVLTSRNQNQRVRTSGELPRELAAYASGSPRDEDVTTVEFHSGGWSSCDAECGLAGTRPSKDRNSRFASAPQCPRGNSASRRFPSQTRTSVST